MAAAVPTILVAVSNLAKVDKFDFTCLKAVWVGAAPLTDGIKNTFEEKTGSIGLPFSDVKTRIISLDGNHELPPGEPGEIILQTPTMMMGYYNRPHETADPIQGAIGDRVPLRTA